MPDYQREKLDAVHDVSMVKLLISLWYSAQDYDARVGAGQDGFERHLKSERAKQELAARNGLFDRAFAGDMGPDAKRLAEHCASTLVQGASQAALHSDFESAWKAELEGRKRKRQAERERRLAAAAQPDLYEEAG